MTDKCSGIAIVGGPAPELGRPQRGLEQVLRRHPEGRLSFPVDKPGGCRRPSLHAPRTANLDRTLPRRVRHLAENGEHVQCHVCGGWFHHLPGHINPKHGLNGDAYRAAFGLTENTKLSSRPYRQKRRELHADVLREVGEAQRQRIREMSTEQRKEAMEDAPRRVGYDQRISGSDRAEAALRSHWGSPDGYGEEFWAQIAADFVEEAKEGRGVYGRLSRKWGVAMNTAQMRVKSAVDKELLEMTGKPFSPAGRLTKRTVALLRSREA